MKEVFKMKKITNIILLLIIVAAVVLAFFMIDIKSTDDYYKEKGNNSGKTAGSVTITIRCDDIEDRSAKHIPDDGIILKSTKMKFKKNSTVYDILLEATAKNKIHLETSGSENSAYVVGMGNIYTLDFGEMSGWSYYVNGEMPTLGCAEYKVKDGDKIEWVYICDFGKVFG